MNVSPVRARITLDNIFRVFQQNPTSGGSVFQVPTTNYRIYLWTVFFKIDGDTVFVDENLKVQGKATVVGTSGDEGDLPGSGNLDSTSIPAANGDFSTLLTPIPNRLLPSAPIPGALGCVAVLLFQNNTPSDAVAQGHQAFNSSLQQALDGLISSLSIGHSTVTDADVQAIQQQVKSAVQGAITNALSTGNKLLTWLGFEDQDSILGIVNYRFSASDLASSPPGGIALQNGYPDQTAIQFPFFNQNSFNLFTWTFNGRVVADPLPISLRRILTRLGTASVRQATAGTPRPVSMNNWIPSVEGFLALASLVP